MKAVEWDLSLSADTAKGSLGPNRMEGARNKSAVVCLDQ